MSLHFCNTRKKQEFWDRVKTINLKTLGLSDAACVTWPKYTKLGLALIIEWMYIIFWPRFHNISEIFSQPRSYLLHLSRFPLGFGRLCPPKKHTMPKLCYFLKIMLSAKLYYLDFKQNKDHQKLTAGVLVKAVLTSLNTAFLPISRSRFKQR